MARRQQPTPQTEYAVLEDRIAKLEAQMRIVSSSQRSTILTSDSSKHLDPVQGEVIVNHPGSHTLAKPEDGFVYYHDGEWRSISTTVAWMAVYDNEYFGQGISTTSSGDNLQFPYIDWSANAGGIFTYDRSDSTIGADNNYNPKLLVSGVYTFSVWEQAYFAVEKYAVDYFLQTSTYPGYKGGGDGDVWWSTYQMAGSEFSDTDYQLVTSITLPLHVGQNGATIYPYLRLRKPSAESDFEMTFNNRLWIAYHGPLNSDQTFPLTYHGDPYPETP